MAYRDFDELFKRDERITFKYGSEDYELPAKMSFALEMKLTEYVQRMQKKKSEEITVEDLTGMYQLLMGKEAFDKLWNAGVSKEELEAILDYWREEREKRSPKARTSNAAKTQSKRA